MRQNKERGKGEGGRRRVQLQQIQRSPQNTQKDKGIENMIGAQNLMSFTFIAAI